MGRAAAGPIDAWRKDPLRCRDVRGWKDHGSGGGQVRAGTGVALTCSVARRGTKRDGENGLMTARIVKIDRARVRRFLMPKLKIGLLTLVTYAALC